MCWLCEIFSPTTTTQVTKQQVDTFEPGKQMPSCQVRVDWIRNEQPTVLCYRMFLSGAKNPFNFISIESGINPLPQQLSHSVGMESDQGLHVDVSLLKHLCKAIIIKSIVWQPTFSTQTMCTLD